MARLLSQTLIRTTSFQSIKHTRLFSNQSLKGQLIELDLDSDTDLEVLGHPKFEDAFHSIMVKQSAPDWLPFVPGSSYWVPPHQPHSHGIVSLLRKFRKPLTDEESMSLSSARGCPSSAYFIQACLENRLQTCSQVAQQEAAGRQVHLKFSRLARV